MTPPSVLIQYDRCRLMLNLPIFFEEQGLDKIRKVFKLIDERVYQNETAIETLSRFWPEWEQTLKHRLDSTQAALETARIDAENKRRTVAALGSALDENIAQARSRVAEGKKWLAHARKRRKPKPEEISEVKDALSKLEAVLTQAMRPKTDHQQAVKEVKRLESAVKTAKAALERGGKVINAYKAIKV